MYNKKIRSVHSEILKPPRDFQWWFFVYLDNWEVAPNLNWSMNILDGEVESGGSLFWFLFTLFTLVENNFLNTHSFIIYATSSLVFVLRLLLHWEFSYASVLCSVLLGGGRFFLLLLRRHNIQVQYEGSNRAHPQCRSATHSKQTEFSCAPLGSIHCRLAAAGVHRVEWNLSQLWQWQ